MSRDPPDIPPPPPDPFEGTPYRLIRPLGEGGTSLVYLVERRDLGRPFAVKLLHQALAGNPQHVDRVRLGAQALGGLTHPNVVSVWNFEHTRDGTPFLVMEYLEGRTLEEELALRGALPVLDTLVFACELCSALEAVHELGIVHRDIKPANLFLQDLPDGERTLKMLDFGSVRVLADHGQGAIHPLVVPTGTGHVVGTPRYISPEAARGERVDHRADIYGVGLVLYAMLAGRGPFDHATTVGAVLAAHVTEGPIAPSRYAREHVPRVVEHAVLKALNKDPADRFSTAAELGAVLRAAGEALLGAEIWEKTLRVHAGIVERTVRLLSVAPSGDAPRAEFSGEGPVAGPQRAAPLPVPPMDNVAQLIRTLASQGAARAEADRARAVRVGETKRVSPAERSRPTREGGARSAKRATRHRRPTRAIALGVLIGLLVALMIYFVVSSGPRP
ncbi:MAG TPA: serine/threonine-protein kinase [Polyangiaceae bacterium]